MTEIVLLVAALYAVWRISIVIGRRKARARRAALGLDEWPGGGTPLLVRCARCGRVLRAGEVRWEARWPIRRGVCAAGCPPGDVDGSSHLE